MLLGLVCSFCLHNSSTKSDISVVFAVELAFIEHRNKLFFSYKVTNVSLYKQVSRRLNCLVGGIILKINA